MPDNLSNLPLIVVNPADYPRIYVATINGRMRTSLILIGLSVLIAGAIAENKAPSSFIAEHFSILSTGGIALLLLAIFENLSVFRPKVSVTIEDLTVIGLFSKRSIRRDQIKNWQIQNNKGRQTLYLYSRVPEVRDLSIALLFAPDLEFYSWLSTLQNLDKDNIKKDWQQITRGVGTKNARVVRPGMPIDWRKIILRSLYPVLLFLIIPLVFFCVLFVKFFVATHRGSSTLASVKVQDVAPSETNTSNAKKGLDVTIKFSGIIDSVDGPMSGLFHSGEHIAGSYTLHTNVSDRLPDDSNSGRYNEALANAQFTVKESGLNFEHAWGPGVLDDVSASKTNDDDEVEIFAWTRTDGSLLNGEAPCCMEIYFDAPKSSNKNLEMLADDSLPVQPLAYRSAHIALNTKAGWTQLSIAPDRPKRRAE